MNEGLDKFFCEVMIEYKFCVVGCLLVDIM